MAGAVVQWLRDQLNFFTDASEVEALAASVPDTGGVFCVPAFAGLGAPHWDAYARGAIVGITRGTGRAHIARAALESIAHQVTDVAEAMRADSGLDLTEIRVDGGAAVNDLLLEMQADLLGTDVVRPRQLETTATGAAYLAGLGVGLWPNTDSLQDKWQHDRRFVPRSKAADVVRQRRGWQRALRRSTGWAREQEADLEP
jgi:glycerol kinase